MILLIITIIVLLLLLVLVTTAGMKKARELEAHQEFNLNTIDDVDGIVAMLDKLMQRQLISDDPDVQNVHRVMVIFHDTLLGYRNAQHQKAKKRKEEEEGE